MLHAVLPKTHETRLKYRMTMGALWNKAGHHIFALWFLSYFLSFFLFPSPNLSRRRLGVALVRI